MHRFLPQSAQFLNDRFTMFETVAVTGHIDDFTVMNQPVEDGRCNRCVAEKVSPFIKTFIGC